MRRPSKLTRRFPRWVTSEEEAAGTLAARLVVARGGAFTDAIVDAEWDEGPRTHRRRTRGAIGAKFEELGSLVVARSHIEGVAAERHARWFSVDDNPQAWPR